MKYCKKCVMPDTRPGIKFNEEGVCYPCLNAEKKKHTDWKKRFHELEVLCDKYRRNDGYYDCIITVSGGKDSYFQTYIMKNIMNMNPLLISVTGPYTSTKTGIHNLENMTSVFSTDLIRYTLNQKTTQKMVRLAFEEYGIPNWPFDLAIYSAPLKLAKQLDIPLIVYGENIAYEYGGPEAKETYSAKEQIKNDVVKPIDWAWWYAHDIKPSEVEMIKYPDENIVDSLEPIYLSYFVPWDGYDNYLIAKKFGFRSLKHEWDREGFIEDYDQLDSFGYLVHPQLKYQKFGHARATDIASSWIRAGRITREEGVKLVNEHDHKMDQKSLADFLAFINMSYEDFYKVLDEKIYNKSIFKNENGIWKKRDVLR